MLPFCGEIKLCNIGQPQRTWWMHAQFIMCAVEYRCAEEWDGIPRLLLRNSYENGNGSKGNGMEIRMNVMEMKIAYSQWHSHFHHYFQFSVFMHETNILKTKTEE